MYLTVFALVSVFGAWAAWRSNPLFSVGATVRFVVVVGLVVAAFVGAMVAVIDATATAPPPVAGAALSAVVLIGTIGMIWAIVAVSTPPVARIPPGTALVTVHRAKLAPWRWRLAWLIAMLIVLAVVLPGDVKDVVGVFGALGGGLGIVLLFTAYIAARGMDRSLTSVEADAWVHWRYSPDDWSAWTGVLVARSAATPRTWIWSRDWKRLALVMIAVTAAIFAFDAASVPWQFLAVYSVAVWLLMIAMVEATEWFEKTAPRRLRRWLLGAPPDTYIGAGGLFADGVYTQWQTPGNFLLDATVDERAPRSLAFRFQKFTGGTTPTQFVQSVLVPAGVPEADIARIQTALSAACPTATVTLAT